MKKLISFFIFGLYAAWGISAFAYDFMADSLAYAINDDGVTVRVTYTQYRSAQNYKNLSEAVIPERVTYEGKEYEVTEVGELAFLWCKTLSSVTIPSTVKLIASRAFDNCPLISSIDIPDGVEMIDSYAFEGCRLKSINIGDGVQTIGDHAFFNCGSITECHLGNGLKNMGAAAFGHSTLESLYISDLAAWCSIKFVPAYTEDYLMQGDEYACNPMSKATHVFVGEEELTHLVIPETVTEIKPYAFAGLKVESVTISPAIVAIGSGAFINCNTLQSVNISDLDAWCNIDFGSYDDCGMPYAYNNLETVSNPTHYGVLYLNGEQITALHLPEGVTMVKPYTFDHCYKIKEVTIPSTMKSIGEKAFYRTNINTLNWNAIDCENGLFGMPTGNMIQGTTIAAINLGDEVETLPDYFAYYTSIAQITIPPSVKTIGYYAFDRCNNLNDVNISDLAAWCEIDFKQYTSNPLYNKSAALWLDGSLVERLVLPSEVTKVNACAFIGCSSLKNVVIPDGVTKIEQNAFANCDNLAQLTLGKGVEEIKAYAFQCPLLMAIYNKRPRPASIGSYPMNDAFSGVDHDNCVLYVPRGYATVYWGNTSWNSFKKIEEWDPDSVPGDLTGDGNVDVSDVNKIIDMVLGKTEQNITVADLDGNGSVDVTDVNLLINIILGK